MALPGTGPISIGQVSVEGGYSATRTTSLNEGFVRTLAGVASGAIGMSSLRGKSSVDLIPNAVNWNDLSAVGSYGAYSVTSLGSSQTISGITGTITLRLSAANSYVNSDPFGGSAQIDIVKNGTGIAVLGVGGSYVDFTVVNGDVITFYFNVYANPTGLYPPNEAYTSAGADYTVTNLSSGSTVLDTFSASGSASGPN